MRDGRKRTKLVGGLIAAAGLTFAAVAPGAEAAPTPGTANLIYTQEGQPYPFYESTFTEPGRTPVIGDFIGSNTSSGRLQEILWYTPGSGGDVMWRNNGDRTFTPTPLSISGDYKPLVGRFAGDPKDDIFWYAPGSGQDVLWDFNEDGTITKTNYSVGGTYQPLVGDFTADNSTDIIWYAPGSAKDAWWDFGPEGKTERAFDVKGTFQPVVGNFAGTGSPTYDYVSDIIWYAPGTAADSLWDFNGDGGAIVRTPLTINGTFTPVPGDFTHDGFGDVIWYVPGTGQDYLWNFTSATGGRTSTPMTINGTYTPLTAELYGQGPHETDILWYGSGNRPDAIWDFNSGSGYTTKPISVTGDRTPVLVRLENDPSGYSGTDVIDRH